jgi:hypothetical protein
MTWTYKGVTYSLEGRHFRAVGPAAGQELHVFLDDFPDLEVLLARASDDMVRSFIAESVLEARDATFRAPGATQIAQLRAALASLKDRGVSLAAAERLGTLARLVKAVEELATE